RGRPAADRRCRSRPGRGLGVRGAYRRESRRPGTGRSGASASHLREREGVRLEVLLGDVHNDERVAVGAGAEEADNVAVVRVDDPARARGDGAVDLGEEGGVALGAEDLLCAVDEGGSGSVQHTLRILSETVTR